MGTSSTNGKPRDRRGVPAGDWARLLEGVCATLATRGSAPSTLTRLARLAVPSPADWCIVDCRASDGSIRRIEMISADPMMQLLLDHIRAEFPLGPEDPIMEVFRTGRALLLPDIPEAALRNIAVHPAHLGYLRERGPKSLIVVPLVARGETFAAVTFALGRARRRYGRDDLVNARLLAERIALPIDAISQAKPWIPQQESGFASRSDARATRPIAVPVHPPRRTARS